jgi:hypothetical protein
MLIYSWNHSQIICYVLLKLLLKEVIKKNENVDKRFCSYFLKTNILVIRRTGTKCLDTSQSIVLFHVMFKAPYLLDNVQISP